MELYQITEALLRKINPKQGRAAAAREFLPKLMEQTPDALLKVENTDIP
jgi:hypothetical protein